MQVNSTTSTTSATPTATLTSTSSGSLPVNPASTLGQADFLKLLTVQLQQQDPMQPMDDSAFIAQMAQFSSLQQMTAMNTSIQGLASNSQLSSATNLIGAQVSITNADKTTVSGTVSGVTQTSTGANVTINGVSYPYTSITAVTTPATTTSSTSTTTGGTSG